jgi:hypothetical protein
MFKLPKLSTILPTRKGPQGSEKKPAWGRQSHIDMLANGLARDQDGWIVGQSVISRNGITMAWSGALAAGSTVVTVAMDGQRYVITSAENLKLKQALMKFLHARLNPQEAEPGA